MYKHINIVSIIVGSLVIQTVGAILGTIFAIACLIIYGNKFLVAALSYPGPVAATMLITLLAGFFGGVVTSSIAKLSFSQANEFIVGFIYLAINFTFMHLTNYRYASEFPWMLIATAILIIPVTMFGGYLYKRKKI